MNDLEAERVAAAIHELRPDWPRTSLLTLIRSKLIQKPRRDVIVALGWVAADETSKTPARVLETGPWWKAAGVEGGGSHGALAHRGPWCKNCYQGETAPIHTGGECAFTLWPVQAIEREKRREIVAQMRADMAANPAPAIVQPVVENRACGITGCIRGSAHTGPHQGPPPEGETA